MKIKKANIKNYRSIQNSGDLYFENKITILAGKNESGKTAILEALEDFDRERKIRSDSISLFHPDLLPEISITFNVTEAELNKILVQLSISDAAIENIDVEVVKTYPNTYRLTEASREWFENRFIEPDIHELKRTWKGQINKLNEILLITNSSVEELSNKNLSSDVMNRQLSAIVKIAEDKLPILSEGQQKSFQQIHVELEEIYVIVKNKLSVMDKFVLAFVNTIPTFIYFSSFENLLPFEIPIREASSNKAVNNFAKIAEIDLSLLQDGEKDLQSKINHLTKSSTTITGEFLDYWNQDRVELNAMLNGSNLVFGFKEEGRSEQFKMQQRSKGFQWFLAFYINLQLRQQSDEHSILLVDEPGLYLHAKAQRDVLKVLESHSDKSPVIFSTHSPYLLDFENLNRLRLVFRDKEKGTLVEAKLHKISDAETLTPILTAIGLELTSGITNLDKQSNVIVEGPSDWYYLTAFKKILDNKEINFIYGGGSGNMPRVGTILRGWGCTVLYLFDNDQGKKDGEKNLTKNWLIEKAQILPISNNKGVKIEDLFTQGDFTKIVLENQSLKYSGSNSEYIAQTKTEKVFLARSFLSNAEKVIKQLSEETKSNFHKVFDVLMNEFK